MLILSQKQFTNYLGQYKQLNNKTLSVTPYLFKDFKEKNNKLCSIIMFLQYYTRSTDVGDIYAISKVNQTHFPISQRVIQQSFNDLQIPQDTRRLLCCHNDEKLISLIDSGHPIVAR